MANAQKNPQTWRTLTSRLDTADTSITSPTNFAYQAGPIAYSYMGAASKLTQVVWVKFNAIGTTTDGVIRAFFYDGATTRYLGGDCDVVIRALIPNPPYLRPWSAPWHAIGNGWDGKLTNGQQLKFTNSNGDDMDIIVSGVDYDV